MKIKKMELSKVPRDVLRLTTRPFFVSVMRTWVLNNFEGTACVAFDGEDIVGWAAAVNSEIGVYVKSSFRRKGVGSKLVRAMGDTSRLLAKPYNRTGKKFYEYLDVQCH